MLTLVEAQKLIQDEVQSGVVYNVYLNNPLLGLLPFQNITGQAIIGSRAVTLGGASTRPLNADYPESTGTVERIIHTLGRLGGKAQVDRFLELTGSNVNDQLEVQTQMKSKAVAIEFQDYFFNGDTSVDPNGFDGLGKLLAGTSQEATYTGNLTLDSLDLALEDGISGNASAIFVNSKTYLAINKLAKGTGMVQVNSLDLVGSKVHSYNGVPILTAGKTQSGTVLADGEVYVVRMGADGVYGIQANTPTAEVITPAQNASLPVYTVRIDWAVGIAQTTLTSAYHLKKA